jgi:lipopolysaccharide biosynthesis protein
MYHTFEITRALMTRLRSESERASYRAAERYRQDGDGLGFICETHQELPAQPPFGRRTLVLFAHFDLQGVVDPYVVYYLEALHRLGATIIFVSGAPTLTPESVAPIRSLCAGIYTRHTLSLDFGSWHLAWCILRQRGWSLDQFDRFVIANDSVYGPLFPIEEMWSSFHDADMYGAIESTHQKPHLQSFFLAWDLNARTRPFLNDFWNGFQYVVDKLLLIRRYEVGLSTRARKAGLSLKPFLSVDTIKATYRRSPTLQRSRTLSWRRHVNNTVYFWDGLIGHLRFPFLKTSLPRYNAPWQDSLTNLPDFLEQYTTYPYELIQANVDRLGCGEPCWVRPRSAVLADRLVDCWGGRSGSVRE